MPLGPNDQDKPSPNRTHGNETILCTRMIVIEQFEVIDARTEKLLRFLESDTVFLLVREILCLIPLDPHEESVS